jgi:DNA polymerase I-like protein with 3'-5' exonuclease and polymerase domains
MGAASLAARIGQSEAHARELLDAHRRTFPRFWRWAEAAVDYGKLYRHLDTVFGWRLHVPDDVNCRSLLNFPAQADGSEMLRLAAIFGTEAGLEIVAPVHDALMILSPLERLDEDTARLRECMARASKDVLSGFEIGTDAKLIRWPGRYADPRGAVMWKRITEILERIETAAA